MTDDEIALKLMRLYRELRRADDADVRDGVCRTIDGLVAQLKHRPTVRASTLFEASTMAGPGDD